MPRAASMEKISLILSAALIQYRLVTDRRTDIRTYLCVLYALHRKKTYTAFGRARLLWLQELNNCRDGRSWRSENWKSNLAFKVQRDLWRRLYYKLPAESGSEKNWKVVQHLEKLRARGGFNVTLWPAVANDPFSCANPYKRRINKQPILWGRKIYTVGHKTGANLFFCVTLSKISGC